MIFVIVVVTLSVFCILFVRLSYDKKILDASIEKLLR